MVNGIPVFLAHGALGGLDEAIFIGIALIFFGMMGFSWWRSRGFEPEEDETGSTPAESGAQPSTQDNPEHISLK
ncbi:MAG TPA: hypothetical protein VHL11_20320 [Phototrophicaceae bacterium]|jgi:hypothetical protein|nr:hypothetical protein [Phototrophicaceae bacterium]